MKRLHLIISGRVQGVGFRYFCYEEALRLGLTGYARNKSDGTVEVEVQGGEEALQKFKSVIQRGPRAARVERVENREMPEVGSERSFQVG